MSAVKREELVGLWKSDPTDILGRRLMGSATLDFRGNGQLIYTSHDDETDRISILTFVLEEGCLSTEQPTAPKVERTRVEFSLDGKLVLEYDGIPVRYIRLRLPEERN